jgi:5-methylcytosine-specific restriction endonuclease McrA
MRSVLLLNADGSVLNVMPWYRAIKLQLKGKVQVFEYFEGEEVHSVTRSFKVPSVMALIHYIFIPFEKRVALNKSNLLLRDDYACAYCDRSLSIHSITIDHVKPVSMGGLNEWRNVVASCKTCNNKKGNRTPALAGMKLLRKPWTPSRSMFIGVYAEQPGYESWRAYLDLKTD